MKKEKSTFNVFNMTLLYIAASLLGVLLEGVWTVINYGHWETHVVSMIAPLCIIYGFGAVIFYYCSIKLCDKSVFMMFVVSAILADVVEFVASVLLEYCLKMRAWDYSTQPLNLNGRISIGITIMWGTLGVLFLKLCYKPLKNLFLKIDLKPVKIISSVLLVVIVIDSVFTSMCLYRWSKRHEGIKPQTKIGLIIDDRYDDFFMQERFCEWSFIEEKK